MKTLKREGCTVISCLMLTQIKQRFCNSTFTCSNETLLARSFIRSLALMMIYGSKVFFVVQTVMLPSIRSRVALTCCNKEEQVHNCLQTKSILHNQRAHPKQTINCYKSNSLKFYQLPL